MSSGECFCDDFRKQIDKDGHYTGLDSDSDADWIPNTQHTELRQMTS